MLKVYIADCTPFAEPDVFRRGLALVKEERKDRILSFRSHADRQRSLSATLLLRLALEKEGISYADSCFRIEANGKPQLCDQGLYFSLSHSGDRALCALVPVAFVAEEGNEIVVFVVGTERYRLLVPCAVRYFYLLLVW